MMSFSTHHLLATFTHKSSVTVAELRDYITSIAFLERCFLIEDKWDGITKKCNSCTYDKTLFQLHG